VKQPRTSALLAIGTVAGMFVIAQGMARDAPPASSTRETAPETSGTPPAHEDESAEKTTEKAPMLDLRRIAPVQGDATAGQAKVELCSTCHGAQGIAIAPLFPNLAGQRAEYLYWQLVEYQRGNVPVSPMTSLVTGLTEADMRDIAVYYASLPADPTPATDAPAGEPAAEEPATTASAPTVVGRTLYLDGDPARGIPPCQGCHGNDARGFPNALHPNRNGHTPYALFPKLRGQQPDYLQTRLAQYQTGEAADSTSDLVMNNVAHRLDAESIAALSHYLSGLGR